MLSNWYTTSLEIFENYLYTKIIRNEEIYEHTIVFLSVLHRFS